MFYRKGQRTIKKKLKQSRSCIHRLQNTSQDGRSTQRGSGLTGSEECRRRQRRDGEMGAEKLLIKKKVHMFIIFFFCGTGQLLRRNMNLCKFFE